MPAFDDHDPDDADLTPAPEPIPVPSGGVSGECDFGGHPTPEADEAFRLELGPKRLVVSSNTATAPLVITFAGLILGTGVWLLGSMSAGITLMVLTLVASALFFFFTYIRNNRD